MRNTVKAVGTLAIIVVVAVTGIAKAGAAPADDHRSDDYGSIMIVFKDGHRQDVKVADIARMEFKTPVLIVFKDGRQQNVPAAEIARIEFEPAGASAVSRAHFVGKWEVGDGNGSNFYITLEASGDARKSIGASHGTWTVGDGRLAPNTRNLRLRPASRSTIRRRTSPPPGTRNPDPFNLLETWIRRPHLRCQDTLATAGKV